jgi:hypothetical protein
LIKPGENVNTVETVTPLAGELSMHGGGHLDEEVIRLSKIDPDSGKEGLRVILKGGFKTTAAGIKRKQQTVVDFVCDKERDGTEGEYKPDDARSEARASPPLYRSLAARADDDNNNDKDEGEEDDDTPSKEVQLGIENDPSLVFDRYGVSDSDTNVDVLHLTWSSKYVCESKADDGSDGSGDGDEKDGTKKPSSHWGVFTWIVIL